MIPPDSYSTDMSDCSGNEQAWTDSGSAESPELLPKMHPLDPARIGPDGLYNRLINAFTGANSEGAESQVAIDELRDAVAEAKAQGGRNVT